MPKERILVVDDQAALRAAIAQYLSDEGYDVVQAGNASEAFKLIDSVQPHGAIIDYSLPDNNGLTVTDYLLEADPNAAAILLTAHGTIDLAVQAMKRGAEQFLTKPVELKTLEVLLRRAIAQKQASRVRQASIRSKAPNPFIGVSTAIKQLEAQAQRLAGSERPILLSGETGTGKTIFARWLHDNSSRGKNPFVDLNCAGFSRDLLESELFGYEKGAFTGAISAKQGLFEVANRGTIFLDEVGDMDIHLQPKLLKVLEESRLRRVGDVRDRPVDIRLIAASHHDLTHLCRTNEFRSDLYFRISTLPVRMLPLRERTEDIPHIAEYLLDNIARELGRKKIELTAPVRNRLLTYSWPGNIREVKNVLERAVLLTDSDEIDVEDLSFDDILGTASLSQAAAVSTSIKPGVSECVSLAAMERQHILAVLAAEGGQVRSAAKKLGIARATLYSKMKEYEINPREND
jgi:DNA-binding NtrC family response regulator